MNRHLIPVVLACGLLGACSRASPVVPLVPECQVYFDLQTTYLDKLVATGRFSTELTECLRSRLDAQVKAHQDPKVRALPQNDPVKIANGCRGGHAVMRDLIQKIDDIPNLSQEEFDALWGTLQCR